MIALDIVESLISFVQNNFLVVLGVLFFLFKLFGGNKGSSKTSTPTFGGDSKEVSNKQEQYETYDEYEDEYSSEQPSLEQQRRAREQQEEEERIRLEEQRRREEQMRYEQQQRHEQLQRLQQAEAIRNGSEQRGYRSRSNPSEQNSNNAYDQYESNNANDALSLKSDELRKAVLWSEVLGQPRSKRPYRR